MQSSSLIHIRDKLAVSDGSADLVGKREETQAKIDTLVKES